MSEPLVVVLIVFVSLFFIDFFLMSISKLYFSFGIQVYKKELEFKESGKLRLEQEALNN